jgi:SAM-dependent methyltransferase
MPSGHESPEFDTYAKEYARLLDDPIRNKFTGGSNFFFERKWELLKQYLEQIGMQPENARWLDVGCGAGDLLRQGSAHFAEAVGCDVSKEMLRACEGMRVVRQNDASRLPFEDRSFDLVTIVCVYHHVEPRDRHALTAEVARVLRPKGIACIMEHNPFNPVTQLIVRRTPVDENARLLRARTARRLLAAGGLGMDLRTTYFLYFPQGLYRKLRGVEASLARVAAGGQYAVFGRKP